MDVTRVPVPQPANSPTHARNITDRLKATRVKRGSSDRVAVIHSSASLSVTHPPLESTRLTFRPLHPSEPPFLYVSLRGATVNPSPMLTKNTAPERDVKYHAN